MGKAYNSKWKVTPLTVNFNQNNGDKTSELLLEVNYSGTVQL